MTRHLAVPAVAVLVAVVVLGGCAGPAPTGAAPAGSSAVASGSSSISAPLTDGSGNGSTMMDATESAAAETTPASTPTSAVPPEGPAGAANPAPAAVPEQLQFSATTLDGAPFAGADLAGKPAVFWFWAPWCPNCRAEAPQVAAAVAANPDVTFIGVAAQDELLAMQSFVTDYGVGGFQHLADLDASIWQRFGVTYQPAYAFVGADGSVDVVKSRVSADELDSRLAQLSS